MLLITFHPSVRKTLFFQKKIKQFNVEFIDVIVTAQVPVWMALLSKGSLVRVEFNVSPA